MGGNYESDPTLARKPPSATELHEFTIHLLGRVTALESLVREILRRAGDDAYPETLSASMVATALAVLKDRADSTT